jgi:hypothetical protein
VFFTPPPQNQGQVCSKDIQTSVVSTTSGVSVWKAPSPIAAAAGETVTLRVPLTNNGTPFESTDPSITPYYYEGTSQLPTDYTLLGQLSRDGTSTGIGLSYTLHVIVDTPGPTGPTATVQLQLTNTDVLDGLFHDVEIQTAVTRTKVDWVETCTDPIGGTPTPTPSPPPTTPPQQVKVQANDQQPAVTIEWRHDDRWPEVVEIVSPGLSMAIQHDRLTDENPRTMLMTGVKWHFSATDNPVGEHVEHTFVLERMPDTKADGSNLFLTFDDPGAGYDAGLLV